MVPHSPVPLPPSTFYTCPGERHAISRSVHLARLGRSYAACRDCPHRSDAGLVPASVLSRSLESPSTRHSPATLVPTGLRGRYLNDFTRQDAYRWGAALACLLWQDRPWTGRIDIDHAESETPIRQPTSPIIVVGYDERPSSPDLAIGAVTGLRHAGACVLDIGMVTRPLWLFAVATLSADAGLFITGAGHDVNWTGCDLVGRGGQPWHPERELAAWHTSTQQTLGRPTRTASSVQAMAVAVPYQAHLRRHFHALRPLKIGCALASSVMAHHLTNVFEGLPVQLQCDLSANWRAPLDLNARIAACETWEQTDLVLWIAEDGEHCRVYDATRQPIAMDTLCDWLLAAAQRDPTYSQGTLVDGRQASLSQPEFERQIRQPQVLAGVDNARRYWWGGPEPRCDAILTLAAILQGMSWSDAPLDEQVKLLVGA